jgi:hypothetical protein
MGKSWKSVPECKECKNTLSQIASHAAMNNFFFKGPSAVEVARKVKDLEVKAVIPYLVNYSRFFSQELLLVRFWNYLAQSDLVLTVVQPIYEQMLTAHLILEADHVECGGLVSYWVYGDVSDYENAKFDCARFKLLCDYTGVTRIAYTADIAGLQGIVDDWNY